MRTRRSSPSAGPTTIRSGPYKSVRTTNDPYDDPPDILVEAKNVYIPDPEGASAVLARPGFRAALNGAQLYAGAENYTGQCVICHTSTDGTRQNFVVHGGRIFRLSADLTTATDVTDFGGVLAAQQIKTVRVYAVSVLDKLAFTDSSGQTTPYWCDPTATPLTRNLINYDGSFAFWTAGAPFYYGGSAFWPLVEVNGVARTEDVSWCEPGDVTLGYEQTPFDDNWTLIGANSGQIFAGVGTNNGFYFFRQNSIGFATGTVGPDLATSSTLDAISVNVGTRTPQSIQVFGNIIYFIDDIGRPWRLVPGQDPQPIWLQLRGVTQEKQSSSPISTANVASSCIVPALNKYAVAPWSGSDGTFSFPNRIYIFDARTGNYEGFWTIDVGDGDVTIEAMGVVVDNAGREQMLVMAHGGYLYAMDPHGIPVSILTTEDGVQLTTEDGVLLTTEGADPIWKDDGQVPDIYGRTGRLGYEDDTVLMVDRTTVTTLNDTPIRVTVQASMTPSSVEGQPEPSASQDDTFRLVCGIEAFGRGPQVTVKPLEADDQWALERISIVAIPSAAGAEDA